MGFFRKGGKSLETSLSDGEIKVIRSALGAVVDGDVFAKQIDEGFLLGKMPNPAGDQGSYTLSLDAMREEEFRREGESVVFFSGFIFSDLQGVLRRFDLHTLEGMLAGYHCDVELDQLDVTSIDVTDVSKRVFGDPAREIVDSLLAPMSAPSRGSLKGHSSIQIEWSGSTYHTIFDLLDGDYLAVDTQGRVYEMRHDPFKIQAIYSSSTEFGEAIDSGDFVLPLNDMGPDNPSP